MLEVYIWVQKEGLTIGWGHKESECWSMEVRLELNLEKILVFIRKYRLCGPMKESHMSQGTVVGNSSMERLENLGYFAVL